ncbi:MAG: hypothetical protein V3R94_04100 [Acidobacteriota bacterium]
MKKSICFTGIALLFVAFTTFGVAAEEGSWTGWIADQNCAKDYTKAATGSHAACARTCLKRGGKVALSTQEGPFLLDFSASQADQHIGHEVLIKGQLDSTTNTIKVSSVSMTH